MLSLNHSLVLTNIIAAKIKTEDNTDATTAEDLELNIDATMTGAPEDNVEGEI